MISRAAALVCLLSALIVLTLAALTPATSPVDANWWTNAFDNTQYYAMAAGSPASAPFVWRPLNPALARLSGLPLPTAFHALTILWLIALGPAVYFMLRSARLAPIYSGIGALLVYSLYYITIFNLSDPYLPDPAAFVFLALAVAFAYRREGHWFMATLAIGVLAKETVLVAIPVWYMLDPKRSLRSVVLVALPALVIFAAMRLMLPDPNYRLLELPGIVAERHRARVNPVWELVPFGVLPVLALFDRRNARVLATFAPMLVLVYAQLLIASDIGRLLVYGFPPMLIMAVRGIENIREFTAKADKEMIR